MKKILYVSLVMTIFSVSGMHPKRTRIAAVPIKRTIIPVRTAVHMQGVKRPSTNRFGKVGRTRLFAQFVPIKKNISSHVAPGVRAELLTGPKVHNEQKEVTIQQKKQDQTEQKKQGIVLSSVAQAKNQDNEKIPSESNTTKHSEKEVALKRGAEVAKKQIVQKEKLEKDLKVESNVVADAPTVSTHERNEKPLKEEVTIESPDQLLAYLKELSEEERKKVIDTAPFLQHLSKEQKERLEKFVRQMPAAVRAAAKELNTPEKQEQSTKGWFQWFKEDILNYSWIKPVFRYGRVVWDYTGGALLRTVGIESKEITDDCFDEGEQFVEYILTALQLHTPGSILDTTLRTVMEQYLPKENTWTNAIAKASLAIGYYGALRNYNSGYIGFKVAEAFVCTSYCKYFAKEQATFMRSSLLERPIQFFARFIPEYVKHGWIESFMTKATDVFKPLFTLSELGSIVASSFAPPVVASSLASPIFS